VSYLIQLSTSVSQLHNHVNLDAECRKDLGVWVTFLRGLSCAFISNRCGSSTMGARMAGETDSVPLRQPGPQYTLSKKAGLRAYKSCN
jgi:hypothetical protein